MKTNSAPWWIFTLKYPHNLPKKNLFLLFFALLSGLVQLQAQPGCTDPPVPTISATTTCDGAPFSLVLSAISPASRTTTGPYDLVINGTTYPDIPLGGTITTVTPPTFNLWPAGLAEAALALASGDANRDNGGAIELGMKFQSSVSGFVKGIRFYNGANTAGTFVGKLWSFTDNTPAAPTGTLLASANFTSITADGWQTVTFAQPILITANTTYIASYVTPQFYASNTNYFIPVADGGGGAFTNGPLTALESPGPAPYNDLNTANGVNKAPGDPYFTGTFFGSNYWIDVDFVPNVFTYDLTSITDTDLGGCTNTGAPLTSLTVTSVDCNTLCTPPTATISATATCDGSAFAVRLASATGTGPYDLEINGTTYPGITPGGTIITVTPPTQNIWTAGQAEATLALGSGNANRDNGAPIELGMKFQSSISGFVKGIRFYNGTNTAGTFTGKLWSFTNNAPAPPTGTLLASANFTSITADGWQTVTFAEPILITANTIYIASYVTPQFYASNTNYFIPVADGGIGAVTNGPLTALESPGPFPYNDLNTANGVSKAPGDPYFTGAFFGSNYWLDVDFVPNTFTYDLTSVTDATSCNSTGAPLQTLTVTSIDCSTLPVSLIDISATPKENSIVVQWSTASETNNLGFELQRSTDGKNWKAISFVNGAGNSTTTRNYSYVDENLSSKRYYYRLKQVDIDGRFVYSPIVSAALSGKNDFKLEQNYPNPFRGETIVKFTLPRSSKVNLSIFDMNGRLIKVLLNESKDSGTHAITVNSGSLSSGLYYYKLQAGDYSAVRKMTVQ